MTTDREALTRQLAKVKPGDTVTVEVRCDDRPPATITGEVWAIESSGSPVVGGTTLRIGGGIRVTALLDHKPKSLTVEELDALPEWSVVTDSDDDLWRKRGDGRWLHRTNALGGGVARPAVVLVSGYGPLTLRAKGVTA